MSGITILLLLHACLLGLSDGRAVPELEVGGLKSFKDTGIVLEKDGGRNVAGPLVFSPDGKRLASGYVYGTKVTVTEFDRGPNKQGISSLHVAAVWQLDEPGVLFQTPKGSDASVKNMTNQFLWTEETEDRKLYLWDVKKGVLVKEWNDDPERSLDTAVAVSPLGDVFATGYRKVYSYQMSTGKRELLYDPKEDDSSGLQIKLLHFSADGKQLIACSRVNKIVAIDVATKRVTATTEGKFAVRGAAVGATGRLLVTNEASLETGQRQKSFVQLRDPKTLQVIRSVEPFQSRIFSVGLSRDERYLIAAGCDDFDGVQRAIRIWDLQSGKQVAGYRFEKAAYGLKLAISQTDRVAILLGNDEPLAVFELADLIREGRADK